MKTDDVKNLRLKISECGKSLESCGTVSVTIAQLNPCGSLTPYEQKEVGNRIALACNSHDELVATLKKMIEHAELAHWDKQDSIFGITCDQARAALKKAGAL